ncbi:hypothetical protein ACP70R_018651 [Stipagrostis hirtigluma subsp. patula]
MSGAGGGGVFPPACRVLRRRAAGEDAGVDGDESFWAVPPRLYDFSQQQQQQPPPSPPKAPSPEPEPSSPGLMKLLQRSDAGWGVRRRVAYVNRLRGRGPRGGAGAGGAGPALVELRERPGDEEGSSGAGKRKRQPAEAVKKEEHAAAAEEAGQDDKRQVVKTDKRGNRKRSRSGLGRRRRHAASRAKRTPREKEDDEANSSGDKKRKRPGAKEEEVAAAEESSRDKSVAVKTENTTSARRGGLDATKRAKKTSPKEEEKCEEERSSPRGKVDRWSAQRYAKAEAAMLDILRARGASAGKPLPRGELRKEARRDIGDTGLLDHLLRHVADKVPAGSAERVRRRYNATGALEYWLEPAELAAVRREAGVTDQYWVPPPGWKPGDPVSPDDCTLAMRRKVEELDGELAAAKRHMKKVSSDLVQVSKEAYISWKGYDCMLKANEKLEKQVLTLEEKCEKAVETNGELKEELLFLKEKFEYMIDKNAKLEAQMLSLSTSFQTLKEDTLLQITGGEEVQDMLMLEQADLFVKEPSKADTDKQEAIAGNAATAGASNATAVDGSASSGGRRASRKCSMRICKPQGAFQWPSAADTAAVAACSPTALLEPLTPGGDLAMTNFDAVIYDLAPSSLEEYLAAGGLPTPTSASSTNGASAQLPLPASPVQPPPPATVATDEQAQAAQPYSGGLELQLRHTDTSSSSGPCGTKALMVDAGAGGGNVGTELALAIPNY